MMGRFVLRQSFLVLGLVSLSSSAFGAEQLGAVSQVIQNKKIVEFSITSVTAQVQVGTQVTVRFQDNVNCEATIEAVADKLARASLADCARFASIVVGQAVHLSAFQTQVAIQPAQVVTATADATATVVQAPAVADAQAPVVEQAVVEAPAPIRKGRFSLGLLASGANKMVFREANLTSGADTETGEVIYETESAGGVFAEYFYAAPNSSGFSLGLSVDASRKIKSVTATVNGASATINGINDAVSFTTIYANYVYQWTTGYFFVGPNFTSPSFQESESEEYTRGSIGVQVGGGVFLNDKVALDFGVRSVGVYVDPYTIGTDSLALNYGSMAGLQLNLKFFFN